MNLLLCNGFNYYNRIVKKHDSYEDYYQYMDEGADVLMNINFNPSDGVNTTQVVNWDHKTPDYVVVINTKNEIESRWFVIDATRTRAGQLQLELHRDLLVDYYNDVTNAPMFIEKATINNPNDIALYNQEQIAFNSIKKSETLLKDSTGVPWVIGYISRKLDNDWEKTIVTPSITSYDIFGTYANQEAFFEAIGYNGTKWRYIHKTSEFTQANFSFNIGLRQQNGTYKKYTWSDLSYYETSTTGFLINSSNSDENFIIEFATDFFAANVEDLDSQFKALNNDYQYTSPEQYRNKYIIIGNDLYRVSVNPSGIQTTQNINFQNNSSFILRYKGKIQNLSSVISCSISGDNIGISARIVYQDYTIDLTQVTRDVYKTKLTHQMKQLTDAPYRIFAIPLGKVTVRTAVGYGNTFDTLENKNDILNIASTIATELGGTSGNLYDIQLLPFFPMVNNTDYWNNNEIKANNLTEHVDYEFITDDNGTTNVGIILFPSLSKFSFDINNNLSLPESIVDKKVINQCDTYRLCSPNYASIFEFNLLKTGSITKFNVDCTYKPYSPYIHINPNWSKLYGEDYDDTRGLICQGDFSLPIINDQWINYQIQNKNYLNSFNRQIDSIELQNKYAKQSDIINASVGAVQGAMSGAAIGGVAGAVGGGLLSAAAGAQDVYINEKLRNDALDLTKDQFNYSLDNIKSLPNTLARVGAFDYNNKLFPILEYYSCSEQEKEIFKNKMLYNGMTIMRVDKINSFSIGNKNYVKGKLIRCETLDEATHEFNTIANELNKGAYF